MENRCDRMPTVVGYQFLTCFVHCKCEIVSFGMTLVMTINLHIGIRGIFVHELLIWFTKRRAML